MNRALLILDFRVFDYFVTKRPHLDEFLRTVRQWYDLAVWSSSSDGYAAQVVEHALGGASELVFAKNLQKVKRKGFDLSRVLIIDDSPEKLRRNYGNHLWLPPFEGQSADRELLDVLPYLEWLSDRDDFRRIGKRTWRDKLRR